MGSAVEKARKHRPEASAAKEPEKHTITSYWGMQPTLVDTLHVVRVGDFVPVVNSALESSLCSFCYHVAALSTHSEVGRNATAQATA